MSLAYHWTPRQIADMTLAQIWVYRSQLADAGQAVTLSAVEARNYQQTQRAAKSAWVERVLQVVKHE